ncbi:hypothetical protein [Amycolatopsis sp.]|uniref:hypothetical protein n=1 Tax=Amycolatopsis sp. TaxID=37632 RepID=UPI002DFCE10E|nr:hypothetical protein [Amycolatopsis sp.]
MQSTSNIDTDAGDPGTVSGAHRRAGGFGMPDAAVDKIVASLNAEPVPPADPLVALLLETAGGLGMLEHYRTTHGGAGEA